MPGYSGNSRQRKSQKKVEERLVNAVTEKLGAMPTDVGRPPTRTLRKKATEFWTNTPIWGVIGVIGGLYVSQVSRQLLFLSVWIIFVFEFIRVRFFIRSGTRIWGNSIAAVLSAIVFIFLYKVAQGNASSTPTLDQQVGALIKKVPFLANAPVLPAPIEIKQVNQQSVASFRVLGQVPSIDFKNLVGDEAATFLVTPGFHSLAVGFINSGQTQQGMFSMGR
jgi:hypothetical protein